jgi:hypothetical protein
MHALHLPPRHLWRTAALALVLAVLVTLAVTGLSGLQLPSRGDTASAPTVTAPASRPGTQTPAWVADPLRPPAFTR